jgi:hypothetical protein
MELDRQKAIDLSRTNADVQQSYSETYPSVRYGRYAFFLVAAILFVLTASHIIRGGLLMTGGRQERALVFASIVLALAGTLGTTYLVLKWSEYPIYFRQVDRDAMSEIPFAAPTTLPEAIRQSRATISLSKRFLAESHLANRNASNWLRAQYHANRDICPDIDSHALW